MRYHIFATSWIGPFGDPVEVDIEKTLIELEHLLEHDQNKDAYWEAYDILNEEKPLNERDKDYWERYNSLKAKLLKEVTSTEGYINMGEILKNGRGRVWWERKNKEDSIRWAICSFIEFFREKTHPSLVAEWFKQENDYTSD